MSNWPGRVFSLLALAIGASLLNGCASLGGEQLPPNQPVPAHKFSGVRPGMTYAQFEALLGPGWKSQSMGTNAKYWFLDDCRTVVVPETVWQVPSTPLTYRIIGMAQSAQTPSVVALPNQQPLLPQTPAH